MNTTRRFLSLPFWGAAIFSLIAGQIPNAHAANVRVSRFWHNHQPIYWPEWNGNDTQLNRVQFAEDSIDLKGSQYYGTTSQHPDNNLTDIFGTGDRVSSYQSGPRNSLANLANYAGYAISYSGSLIENVRSLGNAGELGYGSGWYDGYREATGWLTPGGSRRMEMVGFTYHHSLAPVLPKAVFRKEIQIFKQVWWKAWNKNSNLSDHSKGFFPTEMAFSTEMIDVLKDEGYDWVIVASHHLSRTCPTYFSQGTSEGNYNIMSSPPNRADLLGPSPTEGWWFNSPNPGNCAWNVSPFAYQLHKVKYVNPSNGTEKTMVAVPSDDVLSYKAGYSGADVGMVSSYIAPFANDANNPAFVLPATDGDNAWGGGNSSWNESTPQFFSGCDSAGYTPTTIQDFVNTYGANASDAHIEDGAWIFPEMCYGSPYFLKWVDPPTNPKNLASCYPNTQIDLETPGFALKFWDWAPVIAGANWCETAEQILEDEGGTVADWKIATPYDWDGTYSNPNEVERAWHIFLAGLDSGFNYYGGLGNDDEVKQSLANRRALEMLSPWMTSGRLANDKTPPSLFRPQRFPYNPGTNTFGWFNNNPTNTAFNKKMGSDFYVWTHAYDVSGIPDGGMVLKVRRDKDGVNSMSSTHNETYAGGSDVEGWISIPMTKRVLPSTREALNAAANNSQIDYFITPVAIADYYFAKVTQFRDALVDYYIEAQDTKGNAYKSDIQHVYVVGDGTQGGVSPSASFSPAAPSDCSPLTVTFNAATSVLATATTVNAFYHFSTNSADWTNAVMTRATSNTFTLTFSTVPDNAPQLEICFNDGVNWESNGGANWKTTIRDCDAPEFVNGVCVLPAVPTAGLGATIIYDPAGRALASATNVNIHHGYNNANWTVAPGAAMAKSNAYWTFTYTVPVAATSIVMCFNNGSTWDNNGSVNWTFAVTLASQQQVPNGVVITNPAVATTTVANAVSNGVVQGTAGTNLTGLLFWTNSATASGGSFARETYWSRSIALAEGDNPITLSAVIVGTEGGQVTNASDSIADAAYSGGWTNGSNGGTGFGAWTLYHDANAGHFASTNNGWGFWSHEGTNLSEAVRTFSSALATGQTFHVRMKNGWIENSGSIGVALRGTNGATLWELYFNGGDNYYNSGTNVTDINWTDAGLDIDFTLTGPGAYALQIQPVGGTARQYSGTFSGEIAQFRAWSYNNGKNDTNNWQRDFFVNNLRVTRQGTGGGEAYSAATVHVIREAGANTPPDIKDVELDLGGDGLAFNLTSSISGATYAVWASASLFPSQQWLLVEGTETNGTGSSIDLSITNGLLPTNYYRVGYYPLP